MLVCVGPAGLEVQLSGGVGKGAQDFWLLLNSGTTLGFSILVGLFLHFFSILKALVLPPQPHPPLTGYNQIISLVT